MNVARTEVGCCLPSGVELCRNIERRRLVINQIRQVEDARLEHLKQAPKTVVSRREQIVALATREKMISIFDLRADAEAGGLLSYGANLTEMYRQVGVYAGRILTVEAWPPKNCRWNSRPNLNWPSI
jgi:hypothetical protein